MKNFIAHGDTVPFTAAADVSSGDGVFSGDLFGVATGDVLTGDAGELKTTGVFSLPKAPSQAWTVGAKIYWDAGNSRCTTVDTANTLIGTAYAAVGSGASETLGQVRLGIVA
ncbi:DUF2190 family protein [Leisingera daeponensis]|uniref:DUF2190 family protein n=1 Tax=Leisingera daeponensis TaxID=405746 RepID=UPI001C956169|nr:DUF2190 family protein [Leisingera daeponensis]MBY6055387.1 DUF2190 family protein [Leisingera daeponensis]